MGRMYIRTRVFPITGKNWHLLGDDERIVEAVEPLSGEERTIHEQALAEGYSDEPCRFCDTVFLAHEHYKQCGRVECPFKMGPIARQQFLADPVASDEGSGQS